MDLHLQAALQNRGTGWGVSPLLRPPLPGRCRRGVHVHAGFAVPLPSSREQRLAEGLRRTPSVLNDVLTRFSATEQKEQKETPLVQTVRSSKEFAAILEANPEKLVVLMCKSGHCRPCKMFTRKYSRIAETCAGAIFLDILGDESSDTRRMMIQMDIRVTPTFKIFRKGECVQTVTGINESNLRAAVEGLLTAMAT